jgi:hypothetical protein
VCCWFAVSKVHARYNGVLGLWERQTYICAPFRIEVFLCPADEGLFCVDYMVVFMLAVCCGETCEATGQGECGKC